LKFYGYYLHQTHIKKSSDQSHYGNVGDVQAFDSFKFVAQAEWDTLLFFFGVIMCVGGLGFVGYLELASNFLYHDLGATTANVSIGLLSAVVDNIPVMVAVLQMNPDMNTGQWLLVTLTAGVGGSLLSVGSAAGVAMMGQAKGYYTFFSHLKWTWAVALGYVLSIACHFLVNKALF
ncbi:MAG TPA: sodium:proton antiporter NhaD, partial [Agitococcus sp.]|nr:sodium:proton antiporter NhaD [Agitococcus sp.]